MIRVLLLLVIGIAIGYFIGFHDAQTHKQHIVERVLSRTGGAARAGVSNDMDSLAEKIAR